MAGLYLKEPSPGRVTTARIRPGQAAVVNAAFTPSADHAPWTERLRAASADLAAGVLAMDGKSPGRPYLKPAERLLAQR